MIPPEYIHLSDLVDRQLSVFPGHVAYLQKRFANMEESKFPFINEIALRITQIAGGALDKICDDYRWLSAMVLEEELHFRREGRYRLSKFEDAAAQVYANKEFMSRYMNGLLMSQLWWSNHTESLRFFRDVFIDQNGPDFSHLEIGPGHGLYLYLAVSSPKVGSATGWDISEASLANTGAALHAMGVGRAINLEKRDLFNIPTGPTFKSITFSEVLEHLERPQEALKILHVLLADDGRLFVNAPVNSPAPDHLYLFETPEQVVEMVEAAGFEVESRLFSPCTGATLERARKIKLSISVAIIARKKMETVHE